MCREEGARRGGRGLQLKHIADFDQRVQFNPIEISPKLPASQVDRLLFRMVYLFDNRLFLFLLLPPLIKADR